MRVNYLIQLKLNLFGEWMHNFIIFIDAAEWQPGQVSLLEKFRRRYRQNWTQSQAQPPEI